MQASWHKRWTAYLGIALLIALIAAACGPDQTGTTQEPILPTTTLAAASVSQSRQPEFSDPIAVRVQAAEPAAAREVVISGPF